MKITFENNPRRLHMKNTNQPTIRCLDISRPNYEYEFRLSPRSKKIRRKTVATILQKSGLKKDGKISMSIERGTAVQND